MMSSRQTAEYRIGVLLLLSRAARRFYVQHLTPWTELSKHRLGSASACPSEGSSMISKALSHFEALHLSFKVFRLLGGYFRCERVSVLSTDCRPSPSQFARLLDHSNLSVLTLYIAAEIGTLSGFRVSSNRLSISFYDRKLSSGLTCRVQARLNVRLVAAGAALLNGQLYKIRALLNSRVMLCCI